MAVALALGTARVGHLSERGKQDSKWHWATSQNRKIASIQPLQPPRSRSRPGRYGRTEWPWYVVSKFALEGLTLNAARELGPFNIRCNATLPGMINNARMRGIVAANAQATGRTSSEIEAEYLQYISLRSKIEPSELAAMVLFLASPSGAKVTGELIAVSGNVEWEV